MNHNWSRSIETTIHRTPVHVLVYLDTDEDGYEGVRIRTMLNEYFLETFITVEERDYAYILIPTFPVRTIKRILEIEALNQGAWDARTLR